PVLVADTGKPYGSLGSTWLVSVGLPIPVVTERVFRSVQRPSVVPTASLLPSARNGTELTRYSVPDPVPIAGSMPTTGSPASETGPSTASLTVAASLTSWGLEMTTAIAPSKLDSVGLQNSSVEITSALLSKPTFGWSPKQSPAVGPPSEVSN